MSHVSCLMPHDKNNYFYFIEKISKALKKKKKKNKQRQERSQKQNEPPLPKSFFFWGVGGVLLNM
jgi:Zn-finger protein